MLEPLKQCGHAQVDKIVEFKLRFVALETLLSDGFESFVKLPHSTDDYHVLGAGQQVQRRIQGFRRVQLGQNTSKGEAAPQLVRNSTPNCAEDNRDILEPVVKFDDELQGLGPDGDDHVGHAG